MRAPSGSLKDLFQSVPMIAKVPCDVALEPGVHGSFHLRISALKDGEQLLANTNGIVGELLESLMKTDPFDNTIVLDQAHLISRFVKLFVEGHQVVDEDDQVIDCWNCRYDLGKKDLFVKLPCWKQGPRHTLTDTA